MRIDKRTQVAHLRFRHPPKGFFLTNRMPCSAQHQKASREPPVWRITPQIAPGVVETKRNSSYQKKNDDFGQKNNKKNRTHLCSLRKLCFYPTDCEELYEQSEMGVSNGSKREKFLLNFD